MQENNLIKSIVESTCPHCNKTFLIESIFHPATIGEIFTREMVEEAKKDCLARIETLAISEEKKDSAVKWVNNPDVVFSPGEVESIILALLKPEQDEG